MDVWQGVNMDSLKFHTGLPCPTLLCPADGPPLTDGHLCGRALWPFQGWATRRLGGLRPSSTLLDTPRLCCYSSRYCDSPHSDSLAGALHWCTGRSSLSSGKSRRWIATARRRRNSWDEPSFRKTANTFISLGIWH
jgi:hypothetical protein